MYECLNCGSVFSQPEYRLPDAGFTFPKGILGLTTIEPVAFCPFCWSNKVRKIRRNKKDVYFTR